MQKVCSCCKDFMRLRLDTLQVDHLASATALVSPRVLAAARTIMCILCIVIIGFDASGSLSAGQSFGRWLSFLTSWTWVLCLFVLFPALCVSLYFLKFSNPVAAPCNSWMRLHWIMWEMAASLSLTITILFWALVYKPDGIVRFSSVGVHGLNAACLFVDLILNGLPVVGSHVIFPIIFGFCYIIFSVIYVRAAGAEPNYAILTWTSYSSVLFSVLGLVLIVICFGILCGVQRARAHFVHKALPTHLELHASNQQQAGHVELQTVHATAGATSADKPDQGSAGPRQE